jgi:2-polyprenyl-6-methoxyphenol hydroxylase-like FAD-dependent oxidoreductase
MNAPAAPLRTVVIGAGASGMALALARARQGHPVTVLERDLVPRHPGFGLLLQENGLRALAALGLEAAVATLGVAIDRAQLKTPDGACLLDEPVPAARAVCRADLMELLSSALPAGVIQRGQALQGLIWSEGAAREAVCEGGGRWEGDLFVGADGARSRARGALDLAIVARAGRVKELVAVAHAPDLAGDLGTTFTKFLHPEGSLGVGLMGGGAGRVIWFVQFDSARFPTPEAGAQRAFCLRLLRGFPLIVQRAIAATPERDTYVWHTVDMDPLPRLARGNVVLLGDAAQIVLPFTSQGVNTGLERALQLSWALDGCPCSAAIPGALSVFERQYRARAEQLVQGGRALAASFLCPVTPHMPIPLLR